MENTRLEKIKKLDEACLILKREFVGLDSIIDEIKTAILPWYITPEVIERPVVISLWGMTGTGKTSVIRRLIELLSLGPQSLFFDCGEKNSDEDTILDTIKRAVDREERVVENKSFVFVFDEFQYARSLDENGEELDKPTLRPIWSLLDNGILYLSKLSRYELDYFNGFVEDLSSVAETAGEIKLENGVVNAREDVERILKTMGYFYFSRGVPGMMEACNDYDFSSYMEEEDKEKDQLRPLKILEDRVIRLIYRRAGEMKEGSKDIENLISCSTIGELVAVLNRYKDNMNAPVSVNCSKSLVFVVGNLDEAFSSSGEMTPDVDADIFFEETSKVSVSNIKDALKHRFRPEQIARFGNSLIKYPSFNKESFRELIRREVKRVCDRFKETEPNIEIDIKSCVYDLLYSEGVYPTQGVRPVFTTISTIFTPVLSRIVLKLTDGGKVEISVSDEEGFKKDRTEIILDYGPEYEKDIIPIELTLGKARNPENRKTAYICSVHEVGHAILFSYLTGKSPTSIVSVASDNGGFCTTFDKDKLGEIRCKKDIDDDIMISLAGYEAEQLIYGGKPEKTLLGSSSDIESAWCSFSDAAYNCGYFEPFLYTNYGTERNKGGAASGLTDVDIQKKIKEKFDTLRARTKKVLQENKKLLVNTALILGEKGEISGTEFEDCIKNYGETLTVEEMNSMKEINSSDWYKKVLLEN